LEQKVFYVTEMLVESVQYRECTGTAK